MLTINDRRSAEEKGSTVGFVIGTDTMMSGWGGATGGLSYFAVPYDINMNSDRIWDNLRRRGMKRIRCVAKNYRPGRNCAHLSICTLAKARDLWAK